MDGPLSSYSVFEIHICWKVDRDAKMEPPIHTEYLRSGGAIVLIFIVEGASDVISFCIRSAMPGYMVVPPDSTVLAYRSFLMSTSHFMIELYVVSWIPADSIPKNDGWNNDSGHRKRSFPIVITWRARNDYKIIFYIKYLCINDFRVVGLKHHSSVITLTCPSGSSYDFSRALDDAAVCISCSKSSAT